jgi:hypothetical protein
MIGLINSILVIKFINVASDPAIAIPIEATAAIGFSILIVPLLDTLRVFAVRIFKGCSPFTPDRNHIHHLLMNWGFGHAAITLLCVGINVGFVIFAYTFRSIGPTYLLLIMLSISFAGFGLLYYRKPRRTTITIAKRMNGTTELKTASKVVTLTQETVAADHN